ncbi:cyclin-A1-like isoform X2 [Paramacrobiotus metropolitanus]|uniref:cyclin-A1-like isoform X2 n=1 Tax=Paramacrobiotus metropolitanus TaxID=2943436 RepID=UPI0024465BF2|nr:cyclin-A1-like isoform X2 [Paramacrobiotus metropolitanus]
MCTLSTLSPFTQCTFALILTIDACLSTSPQCTVSVLREEDVFPTALNIYTRFIVAHQSKMDSDSQLQLTAACALHLASKLLESSPMLADELAYLTDDAYAPEDIRLMDIVLLSTLSFDLLCVPPGHYVEAYLTLLGLTDWEQRQILKNETLRRINLALIDVEVLCCKPSLVAAACLLSSLYVYKYCVGSAVGLFAETIGVTTGDILRLCQLSMAVWERHRPEVYDVIEEYHCAMVERQDSGISSMADGMEVRPSRSEEDLGCDVDEDFMEELLADESLGTSEGEESFVRGYQEYLIDSDSGIQDDIHIVPAPFAAMSVECMEETE